MTNEIVTIQTSILSLGDDIDFSLIILVVVGWDCTSLLGSFLFVNDNEVIGNIEEVNRDFLNDEFCSDDHGDNGEGAMRMPLKPIKGAALFIIFLK
jgi:hypothetical protein